MPKYHGKDTYFALAVVGTPATPVDISSYLNDVSFPRPIDTAEASTFGAVYKSYVVGLADSSFSVSGRWDATIDAHLNGLVNEENSGTGFAYAYGPSGSTAAMVKYTGYAMMTTYDITGSIGDLVNFSASFQGIGAVTRGTF